MADDRTYIPELDSFNDTLAALHLLVHRLIARHGKDATIAFDAGHNNIVVHVTPPRT